MPMDREALFTRLLNAYTAYYDVERVEGQEPLVATAFFHVHGVKYVLVKRAQLWAADNNEFVYFFSCPHLTVERYEQCLQLAYDRGSQLIHPDEKPYEQLHRRPVSLRFLRRQRQKNAWKRCRIPEKFSIFAERLDGGPYRRGRFRDGFGHGQLRRPENSGVFEKRASS